jgi:hypothetical protein
MMSEPKKRKMFSIQEEMDILTRMDANKGICVAVAARSAGLGIAPAT